MNPVVDVQFAFWAHSNGKEAKSQGSGPSGPVALASSRAVDNHSRPDKSTTTDPATPYDCADG